MAAEARKTLTSLPKIETIVRLHFLMANKTPNKRAKLQSNAVKQEAFKPNSSSGKHTCSELLLGSDVGGVTALSLSAVGSLRRKGGIALSANHLFALVLSGKSGKRGLNSNGTSATTSKSEDQVKGGFLLDVVVRECSTILELLSGEDESLLIGRDALLVLDLSLDVLNGVRRLNVKGNSLTSESLNENLHIYLLFNNKMIPLRTL